MIDFELSAEDQKILDEVRAQALVYRKYARYYDENEHEFPPDELEEAGSFGNIYEELRGRDDLDSSMGVISMLITAVTCALSW